MTSSNVAAWITEPKKIPLELKEAPLWVPKEDEILIKNHAIAINPVDGMIQNHTFHPLNYPGILGTDTAGEVVSIGPNVTRFKPGDRVLGHALGLLSLKPEDASFQKYTILKTDMASALPENISYEDAAVLPLCLSTAACALFLDGLLNLQLPTEPARPSTGKTLLVWGGASAVGSNAIQLAIAAGYETITTASPKNFEYVKRLGAKQVFDYNSPTIVEDILNSLKGKTLAGVFDCIGPSAISHCLEIAHKCDGSKIVATTKMNPPTPPEGVQVFHFRGDALSQNSLGKAIYEDFLPKALQNGTYIVAPKPRVIGKGLEHIQTGIDIVNKGVSATKIVVSL